jgi:small subunit ribosomal protein S29
MLLLQTAAYARESGWVVLYIPRGMYTFRRNLKCHGADIIASEWIESKTEYAYNPSTKLFNQPALAHSILSSLLTTNPTTLSSIKTKTQIGKYKSNTSISEICKSPKSPESVEILEGVLKTLEESDRPVLVAVDEVQALFSTSGVRTPDFRVLESYDLSTPNLFLEYLTGKKSFVCPPLPFPPLLYSCRDANE